MDRTASWARTVAVTALLSGCAAQQSLMDGIVSSWSGSTLDEVVGQWGPPDERLNAGGVEYFTWHHNKSALISPAKSKTTGSAYGTSYGDAVQVTGSSTTTYEPASEFHGSCDRTLGIRDGIVVSGSWRGNNCPFVEAMEYSTWRKR